MRDRVLNESLRRLAVEAATRFSGLVASGDQIPFDVAESEGPEDSLFHSYVPLTGRYVREREGELRSLPGFEVAREAVEAADVAAPYLEGRGEPVPAEPGERAARALTAFFAALWDGCAEFSLDRERLDGALAVLDAEARGAHEADLLVAPLVGLRMETARLQLPHGVQVVRADSFEAPLEAMRSEGAGRAAWEPQYLAVAEQGEGDGSADAALRQLHELVSVMRLFKGGGVGLGPYAFAPTGEGRWRRLATGAPAPRADWHLGQDNHYQGAKRAQAGGYRLSEAEAAELAELASALEARPDPAGPLAWAVGRFELGCGREAPLEGLSDHLLALRAALDGQGPVGASLPMRAAALVAPESGDKLAARERLEAALELERALMAGATVEGAPALATWVEDAVRRILRDAALGELGTDLGAAADESLIATGLASGDGQIAVTADEGRAQNAEESRQEDDMQDTRILEPIPAEDEIKITATDWLEEVEVEEDAGTLEWPAEAVDVERRERIDTPRVRHLFPVPEDADWEVRELDYDRRRRAG